MSRAKQQPVHDEYGEIVGYLEAIDGDRGVRVLDAEGQQVATAHSITIGKRHLTNLAYNARLYAPTARRQRR